MDRVAINMMTTNLCPDWVQGLISMGFIVGAYIAFEHTYRKVELTRLRLVLYAVSVFLLVAFLLYTFCQHKWQVVVGLAGINTLLMLLGLKICLSGFLRIIRNEPDPIRLWHRIIAGILALTTWVGSMVIIAPLYWEASLGINYYFYLLFFLPLAFACAYIFAVVAIQGRFPTLIDRAIAWWCSRFRESVEKYSQTRKD